MLVFFCLYEISSKTEQRVFQYGVDFKDIFMKCDMLSDYQWMNFRLVYYGDLRWPLEILSGVNYFSNCYCLIALAYERYVYTVKFADAKTILTTRRRVVTYSAIAFLTVLVPALLYLDVRLAEKVCETKISQIYC